MNKFTFNVEVEVDKLNGQVIAVYLSIRAGKVANTQEFAEGSAFANYNRKGELLGIELLGPCKIQVFDKIAKTVPVAVRQQVRNFFKGSTPREMILAS